MFNPLRRMALLAAATLAACLPARALEPADLLPKVVGLHVASRHFDGGDGLNNWNPGIYARWANGLTAGTYRNSVLRDTVYVGWTITDRDDRYALTIGAASGYDWETRSGYVHYRCRAVCVETNPERRLVPMLVPSVRFGITQRTSVRLSAALAPNAPKALHLSVEGRF